jgi:Cu+-exporting ATPase
MTGTEKAVRDDGSGATEREIVLNVGGMMCAHCVRRMETALRGLPGIARVAADLGKQQVQVAYDPSLSSPEAMKQAIEKAGYQFHGLTGEN